MHQSSRVVVGAVLGLVLPAAFLAAQEVVPLGKQGNVELRFVTRVGSQTLQPGLYRFQHHAVDRQHYLLVSRRPTGKEIAKLACEVKPLDKKARDTEITFRQEPDGGMRLTEIRIRGEGGGHIIALEPRS